MMCDYSLRNVRYRMAIKGEPLQLHHFPTGSWGFTSPALLQPSPAPTSNGWGQRLINWLGLGRITSAQAVYVPSGARLIVREINQSFQQLLEVGAEEEVTFIQRCSVTEIHGDGIRFRNGWEILLQHLPIGQRFDVLSLTPTLDGELEVWQEIERIAQASGTTVCNKERKRYAK
jgi:hypothetical protein